MAQLQLPRVDADALRDRVRDLDLSRLADLGDGLRIDLAEGLKNLDVDALRRLDLDSLRHLDVDALRRLDLDSLRHLGDGLEGRELDLDQLRDSPVVRRIQRALGREPRKRNLWDSLSRPSLGATIVAGAVVVLAGAAIGGLIAWLYQPGKGEHRRARIRRRIRRAVHRLQGGRRRT